MSTDTIQKNRVRQSLTQNFSKTKRESQNIPSPNNHDILHVTCSLSATRGIAGIHRIADLDGLLFILALTRKAGLFA